MKSPNKGKPPVSNRGATSEQTRNLKWRQPTVTHPDRRSNDFKNLVSLLSWGCDWLTCTQQHGPEAEAMRTTALALADCEIQIGMFGRPWGANGYEGFSVGHLEYGERSMDVICRLHSGVAHSHWRRVYEQARNVSRFDLQVTVTQGEDPLWTTRRHLRELQRYSKAHNHRPQCSHRVDTHGGMTVYSGSPQSLRYLRIYDKQRESKLDQWYGATRYEVQFNGRAALWASSFIYNHSSPAIATASLVFALVAARGGKVKTLLEAVIGQSDVSTPRPYPMQQTNAERQLQWLSKSVAPSVRRLVALKGEEFVLNALGFLPGAAT